jgi:hypothetical protein
MAKKRKRRDPDKERFWRRTMRRQHQSGLTVSAFCAAEGLKDWSFHWWRRELAKRDREQPASKPKDVPSFVPVQLVPNPPDRQPASVIEIVLPAGQTVRVPPGFDVESLTGVLEVLETRSC